MKKQVIDSFTSLDVESSTKNSGHVIISITQTTGDVIELDINTKKNLNWLILALKQAKELAFN